MIFRRSPDVPQFNDYRTCREYLRRDFRFRCAYCLTHEHYFQDGDGGEIDHFRPLHPPKKTAKDFSHLRNVYSNLYWTCSVCNNIKGNKWPTDAQYEQELRFLDPCEEDHDDQWQTLLDGTVTPVTNIGQYTVKHLRLNRDYCVRYRRRMQELQQKAARIRQTLETEELSDAHRLALTDHLHDIEHIIEPPVYSPLIPEDMPDIRNSTRAKNYPG